MCLYLLDGQNDALSCECCPRKDSRDRSSVASKVAGEEQKLAVAVSVVVEGRMLWIGVEEWGGLKGSVTCLCGQQKRVGGDVRGDESDAGSVVNTTN